MTSTRYKYRVLEPVGEGLTCAPRSRMVSYQKWTSIAFEIAREQGMVSTQETNRDLISVASAVWNDRKPELSTATIAEARLIAREEIHVQRSL